jgi:8-oxo-dGTP pyrophosphatase MutT (NUDIX family)
VTAAREGDPAADDEAGPTADQPARPRDEAGPTADQPARPRDAATVMLVRDQPAGMEVFMLRRNLNSDFVGGAYVFPGGKVDDSDRTDDLSAVCDGRSDEGASDLLGIDRGGLAYWVAAIRECFEEAGVLLAFPAADGERRVLSLVEPAVAARYARYRTEVYAGTLRLVDLCLLEGLCLDARRIHYFSHWITPEGGPRRFDTRFFVAAAPPEQVPLHDDGETIANLWIRPADALDRHHAGRLELILPTMKNLEAISRFDRSEDLLAAAAALEQPPTILPRVVKDSEGLRIVLPGDPGYDDAVPIPPFAGLPLHRPPGGWTSRNG